MVRPEKLLPKQKNCASSGVRQATLTTGIAAICARFDSHPHRLPDTLPEVQAQHHPIAPGNAGGDCHNPWA